MDLPALARQLAALPPQGRADALNAVMGGFESQLGLRWSRVADDRVEGVMVATAAHTQPYGLVHGGVYAALAESACSVGAALAVLPTGHNAVGVENHTRFRRASRPGATLTVVARPAGIDGRDHRWEANITDEAGRLCASAVVVVRALPQDARVAGARVALRGGAARS